MNQAIEKSQNYYLALIQDRTEVQQEKSWDECLDKNYDSDNSGYVI